MSPNAWAADAPAAKKQLFCEARGQAAEPLACAKGPADQTLTHPFQPKTLIKSARNGRL
jgi:hypothetical protein